MLPNAKLVSRVVPILFKCGKTNLRRTLPLLFRSCDVRLVTTTSHLWDRLYSDKHEWVEKVGKVATVGISHYAQEALGDVVYAQLPDVGSEIGKKEECGALESVKAASEVYSPVSGVVLEKNTLVEETPALVNQSCYDKGWLFKVEMKNQSDLDELMTEDQYKEFLKTDQH